MTFPVFHRLRIVVITIVGILLGLPAELAFGELQRINVETQAYVIVVARGPSTIRNISFASVGSRDRFTAGSPARGRIQVVAAGRYYLKTIATIYDNVGIYPFDEPKSDDQTISIPKGTVTYIGDWKFEESAGRNDPVWSYEVEYPNDHMLAVKEEFPWITEYPLQVAWPNGEELPLNWD